METTGTHSLDAWADLAMTLRRYARGLTGSADAADDLTQQTIARLLARSPDKVTHLGYVYATMTRLWLDEQRSLRRRVARLSAVLALGSRPPHCAGAGRPAWLIETDCGGDMAAHAARALDRLPPRRRAAIVLKAVAGLSYEQIGASLGCTAATVRGELHEARRALRRALGGARNRDAEGPR